MTTFTTQTSDDLLAMVVARTTERLHAARPGIRCKCGACRHQIVVASRRSGVAISRIVASLPPECPVALPSLPASGGAKKHRNPFVVMDAVTVTQDGRQRQGAAAALALLGAA